MNNSLIYFFCVVIVIISCADQADNIRSVSTSVHEENPPLLTASTPVINDLSDLRAEPDSNWNKIYTDLTPLTRYNLWVEKLNEVKNTPSFLNAAQEAHIDSLLHMLSASVYDFGSPSHQQFANTDLRVWYSNASTDFSTDEMVVVFGSLGSISTVSAAKGGGSVIGSSKKDCHCNKTDDWCQFWNGPINDDCDDDEECISSSWGCGIVGVYRCNGLCV